MIAKPRSVTRESIHHRLRGGMGLECGGERNPPYTHTHTCILLPVPSPLQIYLVRGVATSIRETEEAVHPSPTRLPPHATPKETPRRLSPLQSRTESEPKKVGTQPIQHGRLPAC